jgi:hypothetical protein
MRVVKPSQKKHAHLESEDIHIHSLVLNPLFLIHNVDEDTRIKNEAAEEQDHEVVAHFD